MEPKASAIVKVNTATGCGSAFYLKDFNIFVTNYHVVAGNKQVALETNDKETYLGNVVLINPIEDLAIVTCDTDFSKLPIIKLTEGDKLTTRDEVFALGYPYGMPYTETKGIISAPKQLLEGKYYIQTDAPINEGNSGGPLVNVQGDVIGITTSKFKDADNIGFAVPVSVIKETIKLYQQNNPQGYNVMCKSCQSLLTVPTEYCDNCGDAVEQDLFKNNEISTLAKMVEDGLTTHGINPIIARNGYEYWNYYKGSSLIRIYIYDDAFVCSSSRINNLPTGNVESILRYLLSDVNNPYKMGTSEGQIGVSYRVHSSDLFNEKYGKLEMKKLIELSSKADELDNYLLETYNCPLAATAKV